MASNEGKAVARFVNAMRKQPECRVQAVESSVSGLPDVNICIAGVESWIEFKSPIMPKNDSTRLFTTSKLRRSQVIWFKQQLRAGGRAFVMAACEHQWLLLPGHLVVETNFNAITVKQAREHLLWEAPTKSTAFHWDQLWTILKTWVRPTGHMPTR